jgi:hypothetical protein
MHPPNPRRAALAGRRPASIRSRREALEQVDIDLAEERANALGRVGTRLEEAIADWQLLVEVGEATVEQVEAALDEVARSAWALLVQRDCAGFRGDNLQWIRRHYDIPAAALRRI